MISLLTDRTHSFRNLLRSALLSALLACTFVLPAQQATFEDDKNIPERPAPPRLVNDLAGILSVNETEALEQKLRAYNDSTSTQIAVVTVTSLNGYAEDDYAIRLARKWGIGQKDKDNGLLLLISKEDRAIDIELGYGLESYITDGDAKRIIDDILIPQFRQSNFYEGINDATDRLIGLLQGTYVADPSSDNGNGIPAWVIILIIVVIFFIILPNIGKGGGNWTGGSRGWTRTAGGFGGFGGGSWSSGSGGGFGGFGGGSFGGGGASGRW